MPVIKSCTAAPITAPDERTRIHLAGNEGRTACREGAPRSDNPYPREVALLEYRAGDDEWAWERNNNFEV